MSAPRRRVSVVEPDVIGTAYSTANRALPWGLVGLLAVCAVVFVILHRGVDEPKHVTRSDVRIVWTERPSRDAEVAGLRVQFTTKAAAGDLLARGAEHGLYASLWALQDGKWILRLAGPSQHLQQELPLLLGAGAVDPGWIGIHVDSLVELRVAEDVSKVIPGEIVKRSHREVRRELEVKPLPLCTMRLVAGANGSILDGTPVLKSNADGDTEWVAMQGRGWYVDIEAEGHCSVRIPASIVGSQDPSLRMQVVLVPGTSVHCTVRADDGSFVPGTTVRVESPLAATQVPLFERVDAGGTFQVVLPSARNLGSSLEASLPTGEQIAFNTAGVNRDTIALVIRRRRP